MASSEASIVASDDPPPVLARRDITWDELDLKRFAMWNCSIFFGIRCVSYPFMVLKTRLQAQHKHDRYKGVWNGFTGILKSEGPRGLYQGFVPWQAGSIFSQFLYITSLEYLRAQIPQSIFFSNLVAGGLAAVVSSVLQVPIEVITQRQQIQDRSKGYIGTIEMMRRIAHTEGMLRGFYRGWTVTLLLHTPYSSLWWVVYGSAKSRLQPLFPLEKQQRMVHATCGLTAATVAAVLTNPLDVIKTNLQVANSDTTGHRPTISSVVRRLWKEEGIRLLGKGGIARVMHVAPSAFLVILGYEEAKRLGCKT